MRYVIGFLASAGLLFGSAAIGVLGTWALVGGAVAIASGAVAAAIAMEARDHGLVLSR